MPDDEPILCSRCAAVLEPGRQSFYVVRIEAFADPSPPEITAEDLRRDLEHEIDALIEQSRDVPEAELMDQVHRRMTIFLCWPCYRRWIENPAGDA